MHAIVSTPGILSGVRRPATRKRLRLALGVCINGFGCALIVANLLQRMFT
jgi:hypothetical protein